MYALLNEIWDDMDKPIYQSMENIMDIYMTEPSDGVCQESKEFERKEVVAYDQFSLLKNACTIDSMYDDEAEIVKSTISSKQINIESEEKPKNDQIYKNLVEKFAQENQVMKQQLQNMQVNPNYLELGIYIISGIIIIFFMEQILKIGIRLKV